MKEEVIFGVHPISEALEAHRPIQKIYINRTGIGESIKRIVSAARKRNIPLSRVHQQELKKISMNGNHQNVCAVMSAVPFYDIQEIITSCFEKGKIPFILVLDRVTDIQNFGAIARSAECFSVDALVIKSEKSAPINEGSIKASSGALMHLPVCRVNSIVKTIQQLKNLGLKIIAASEKGAETLQKHRHDESEPLALVVGNENNGISPEVLAEISIQLKILTDGNVQSLNVSASTAIFLHHFRSFSPLPQKTELYQK